MRMLEAIAERGQGCFEAVPPREPVGRHLGPPEGPRVLEPVVPKVPSFQEAFDGSRLERLGWSARRDRLLDCPATWRPRPRTRGSAERHRAQCSRPRWSEQSDDGADHAHLVRVVALPERQLEYGRQSMIPRGRRGDPAKGLPARTTGHDDVARLLASAGFDDDEIPGSYAEERESLAPDPKSEQSTALPRSRRQVEPALDAPGRQALGSRCEGRGRIGSGSVRRGTGRPEAC